jgi:hypothetical protein
MQGNKYFRKTVHKATHWWKHGKHKGLIEYCLRVNRANDEQAAKRRATVEMYPTVREAFASAKKKSNGQTTTRS